MQTSTWSATRLDGPKLTHRLHESRIYSIIIFALVGIIWGIMWFVVASNDGNLPRWFTNFVLTSLGLCTSYWLAISFFIKTPPEDHALVDATGKILLDFGRTSVAMWRWEYANLMRHGKLVGYARTFETVEVQIDRHRFTIEFWTGRSLEDTWYLEQTLKSLRGANLDTPQKIVLCHLYDILSEYPTVIADLTNPLRIEQQEVFQRLLTERLTPLLSGTGITAATKNARFALA